MGGIVVDNTVFRLLILQSVLDISVIEVQSCPKSHSLDFGWDEMRQLNFVVHQSFPSNVGGILVDNDRFPLVDILIRSRDIRHRSPKLSEIVPNFEHFALPNFSGQAHQKLYANYHASLMARHVEKVREVMPHGSKDINSYTHLKALNFRYRKQKKT